MSLRRSLYPRVFRAAAIAAALTPACADEHRPGPVDAASSQVAAATATTSAVEPPAPATSSSAVTAAPSPPHRVALEEKAMGTKVTIVAFTTDQLDEQALKPKLQKGLDEIRRLEALMTTWRDDSEISRINAAAGQSPVPVGDETLAVIQKSLWISGQSEGVFDITFEAMHGLWKFDEDREAKVPDKAAIEKARKLIDYRHIKVDADKHTVFLDRAGMRMSLGGIAKGFAVDRAAAVLAKEGLTDYFVQAGGDLLVRGKKPDGSSFKVGVRDPRVPCDLNQPSGECYFALLEVQDHAFSTAGDYERSYIKDGKRYHHIIDPRTGYPATASRSVTIWAKDAFTADAVDDAVFILGPVKGLALVESLDDCGAVIVDAKNKVYVSKRLKDRVQVLHPPTDGI